MGKRVFKAPTWRILRLFLEQDRLKLVGIKKGTIGKIEMRLANSII